MSGKRPFQFKPDPQAASPLYMQLAHKLAQAIREGQYQADEALPSERVLSESLELSRVTARKAIDRLVEQGLIIRKRGSGNYIAPKLEQPLSRLTSFSEELHQRGFKPSSRWLARGFSLAAPDEQLSLGLSTGERVARLERLRLADAVVMAYEVSVLPETVLPDPPAVEASLYAHLAKLGRAPVRALQHIRAINAEPKLASRLAVPVGQAVLFITRVGFLESGLAVELTHSYCRSDYYDFVAEMRREG
jgi:GntR family transcriptional regulator